MVLVKDSQERNLSRGEITRMFCERIETATLITARRFSSCCLKKVRNKTLKGLLISFSKALILLKKMLTANPQNRASAKDCLENSFFDHLKHQEEEKSLVTNSYLEKVKANLLEYNSLYFFFSSTLILYYFFVF